MGKFRDLKGKKKRIAKFLDRGVLTHNQIAKITKTTEGFVQKVQAELVNKGLIQLNKQRSSTIAETKQKSSLKTKLPAETKISVTNDLAILIYEMLNNGVSLLDIAKQFKLRSPDLVPIYKEWQQIRGYDTLSKMYNEYGPQESEDFIALYHEMKKRSLLPNTIVPNLERYDNLKQTEAKLNEKIETLRLEEKKREASNLEAVEELNNTDNKLAHAQKELELLTTLVQSKNAEMELINNKIRERQNFHESLYRMIEDFQKREGKTKLENMMHEQYRELLANEVEVLQLIFQAFLVAYQQDREALMRFVVDLGTQNYSIKQSIEDQNSEFAYLFNWFYKLIIDEATKRVAQKALSLYT